MCTVIPWKPIHNKAQTFWSVLQVLLNRWKKEAEFSNLCAIPHWLFCFHSGSTPTYLGTGLFHSMWIWYSYHWEPQLFLFVRKKKKIILLWTNEQTLFAFGENSEISLPILPEGEGITVICSAAELKQHLFAVLPRLFYSTLTFMILLFQFLFFIKWIREIPDLAN